MSEPAQEGATRNPIRRLYDWVLGWADTPYGVPALALIAFAESSFFPLPPDILLIALALAKPHLAFYFALWCTAASVIGGIAGYMIGYGLWATFEPILINKVFSQANFDAVTSRYHEWGEVAVFAAAFTPIPYKVFTIAAGVAKLDLLKFIGASLLGRGGRFFLVALVIRLTGQRAKDLIDRYFNLATILGTLLLIGGFLVIKLLR
ncbi:MAG: DedA family protein [Myxococcales bacterium]|nr:DedA family protein [Myxococcales bacterium]MCB9706617.1 DedA family protein [Myxococcales bacterium]